MTTECKGNCQYGDSGFGCNPDEYDGSKCTCKQCPNFKLCKVWAPPWLFDCCNGRCQNCDASFRKNLEFRESTTPEECPICLEEKLLYIKHPADCNHFQCSDCFKEQWWPNSCINLDPTDWGFRTDCNCEECIEGWHCDNSMELWKRDYPEQYLEWQEEESRQQEELDTKLNERVDPAICPLCRANVKNAHNNSWKHYLE